MKKIIRHRDVLFSTLSEITSLIVAGHDKRLIFRRVLDCATRVLDAEKVYLFELEGNQIVRYTRDHESADAEPKVELLEETAGLLGWMIKETENEPFTPGR